MEINFEKKENKNYTLTANISPVNRWRKNRTDVVLVVYLIQTKKKKEEKFKYNNS